MPKTTPSDAGLFSPHRQSITGALALIIRLIYLANHADFEKEFKRLLQLPSSSFENLAREILSHVLKNLESCSPERQVQTFNMAIFVMDLCFKHNESTTLDVFKNLLEKKPESRQYVLDIINIYGPTTDDAEQEKHEPKNPLRFGTHADQEHQNKLGLSLTKLQKIIRDIDSDIDSDIYNSTTAAGLHKNTPS